MAREEKQANIYAIPKTPLIPDMFFGGRSNPKFRRRRVVVTLPFLGIFLYGWANSD